MSRKGYESKVLGSLVPQFVAVLGSDAPMLEKAQALIALDAPMGEEYTFLLARALGYALQAYLEFNDEENNKAIAETESAIEKASARDPFAETLALVQKAKSASAKANAMRKLPEIESAIASEVQTLKDKLAILQNGAVEAFTNAFVLALRFGVPTEAEGSSTRNEPTIEPGVYRSIYGKKPYRFVFKSSEDWHIFSVKGKDVSELASYDTVSASDALEEDSSAKITSITTARKAIKALVVGYAGFSGIDAIARGFSLSWLSFSAGNHNSTNWQKVHSDPAAWLAHASEKGTLPKENEPQTD